MGYDIEKIRSQVRAKMKKGKDPTEFRAPKVDAGQSVKFRFYVLPPLAVGDACNEGKITCERDMELFAIPNGSHYIDNKRIGCPRVINEEDCAICEYGFDLMSEIDGSSEEGKKKRSQIGKDLLPGQYHLVNIYFPPVETNPEEVRGKVLWYNAPKTIVDTWLECLYRDDDGGDPDELMPFGVFFDENKAYQFQLEVTRDGQMNSYKKSKFLTTGGARPIAVDKETKKADLKRIKTILSKRHNLWEKMPTVDLEEVARVAAALSGRASAKANASSGGFDRDEDAEIDDVVESIEVETTEVETPEPVAKPVAKPATKPAAVKPAVAKPATKPAAKPAAAKPAVAKPATKPAAKPEPELEAEIEDEPEIESEPELESEATDELAGESPVSESEGGSDADSEVDRLLDELNG
jgi:hypothetical protein